MFIVIIVMIKILILISKDPHHDDHDHKTHHVTLPLSRAGLQVVSAGPPATDKAGEWGEAEAAAEFGAVRAVATRGLADVWSEIRKATAKHVSGILFM
jgi:hypothetical protein